MILYIFILIFSILLLTSIWFNKRHSKAPPGPTPWPILGNLVQLSFSSSSPLYAVPNLSKIYGPIYSLNLGSKNLVVIASKPMIEAISLKEELLGRDLSGISYDRNFNGRNLGIVLGTGEDWRKSRTWTFNCLKNLGFGKTQAMEHFVREETEKLFSKIDSSPKNIMESDTLLGIHLMTLSYQMINCRPLTKEDEQRIQLLTEKAHLVMSTGAFGAGLATAFPFLRFVMPGYTGKTVAEDSFNAMNKVGKALIDESMERIRNNEVSDGCFSDLFALKMMDEKGNKNSIFFLENFQITLQDIILGSTDTTNGILQNAILQLSLQKDIQEKAFKEMQKVGGDIEFADMKRLPYVQAVIHESLRHTNVVPNFIPRQSTKDFMFQDYFIAKGTIVMPDMTYWNTSEDVWENAHEFNPSRFLDVDGKFMSSKNSIPFGTGPRKCPGELHGTMTLFLFLTRIIQKYVLSIPDRDPQPKTELILGFTLKPHTFRIQFSERAAKKF